MSSNNLNDQLIKAVNRNKARKIKKILSKGADPNTVIDNKGKTVLIEAAYQCSPKTVLMLIEFGADINRKTHKKGMNAFLNACSAGCFEIIKILAEAGANILDTDASERNAFMYAVKHKDIEILKYLSDKGADINALDDEGNSVLYYASEVININTYGKEIDYEFIKQLIDLGADINSQNKEGESFLTTAVRSENIEFVKFLLNNGADVKKHGNKVFSVAVYNDSRDIVALLREYTDKSEPLIIRYKYETECEQCNRKVSFAEPIKQIICPHCSAQINIKDKEWNKLFEDSIFLDTGYSSAKSAFSNPGNYEEEVQLLRTDLLCLKCNEKMNISDIDEKNEGNIKCKVCNHEHQVTDPDEWIKAFKVFGLSPCKIIKNTDKAGERINLELDCLACSAPMKLTDESPRNYICEHCGAKQYLTDPVWLKLHPVKTDQYWYVYFK